MSDVTQATYEHVVFAVTLSDFADKTKAPPPTLIAQTRKHAERQILKDVSSLIVTSGFLRSVQSFTFKVFCYSLSTYLLKQCIRYIST